MSKRWRNKCVALLLLALTVADLNTVFFFPPHLSSKGIPRAFLAFVNTRERCEPLYCILITCDYLCCQSRTMRRREREREKNWNQRNKHRVCFFKSSILVYTLRYARLWERTHRRTNREDVGRGRVWLKCVVRIPTVTSRRCLLFTRLRCKDRWNCLLLPCSSISLHFSLQSCHLLFSPSPPPPPLHTHTSSLSVHLLPGNPLTAWSRSVNLSPSRVYGSHLQPFAAKPSILCLTVNLCLFPFLFLGKSV